MHHLNELHKKGKNMIICHLNFAKIMLAQITQASSLSSISFNLMIFHLELFLTIVIFFSLQKITY